DHLRKQPLHRCLACADRDPLVHHISDRNEVIGGAIHTHHGNDPSLLHRIDRPMQRCGRTRLKQELSAGDGLQCVAGSFGAHCIDAHISTHPVGRSLEEDHRIADLVEIVRFAARIAAHEFQAIVHLADHDHTPCTEKPCTTCGHDTHWAGTEHHHCIARLDTSHLCGLVTGGHYIGEHDRIIQVHSGWDHG